MSRTASGIAEVKKKVLGVRVSEYERVGDVTDFLIRVCGNYEIL